jgi:hypothetical protein
VVAANVSIAAEVTRLVAGLGPVDVLNKSTAQGK